MYREKVYVSASEYYALLVVEILWILNSTKASLLISMNQTWPCFNIRNDESECVDIMQLGNRWTI